MANTNYIVAIDLGTSHLVGMVGVKNAQDTHYIIVDEVEDSASCIQRGCVYNVTDTAHRIHRLLLKLQNKLSNKLPDFKIEKVYIGVGGQSLHAVDHFEVKILNTNAVVTEEDVNALDEECLMHKPEHYDVLGVSSPVYYVDGKATDKPVGIRCKRIEAHYKLIVGRTSIRNDIKSCFEMIKEFTLAGIIVSPLSLAETVLSNDQKELGCALIDFGAGTTSVVVYKRNQLAHLCVIPLGSDLITKDLTSLPFVESDAERLKTKYGSAIANRDKEQPVVPEAKSGIGIREINTVVEARIQEIVENVHAQIKLSKVDSLGAGVVITGGASALNNLEELVHEKLNQDVSVTTIQPEWMENEDDRTGNPLYMTAISLIIKGTDSCVSYDPPPMPDRSSEFIELDQIKKDTKRKWLKKRDGEESKGDNLFKKLFDSIVIQD